MLQELCCRDGAAVTVLQGRCAAAASRANPGLSAGRGANGRSVGLTARVKRCAAAAAAAAAGPPSPSPSRPAPLFLAQALPPLPSPPLHHARKLAPCPSPPHRCLSVPRPYPPTIRLPLPHFPRPTASPGQLLLPPPPSVPAAPRLRICSCTWTQHVTGLVHTWPISPRDVVPAAPGQEIRFAREAAAHLARGPEQQQSGLFFSTQSCKGVSTQGKPSVCEQWPHAKSVQLSKVWEKQGKGRRLKWPEGCHTAHTTHTHTHTHTS